MTIDNYQLIMGVEEKMATINLSERITVNPNQCGGRPCIRGMRIRVIDVLELQANGVSLAEILEELPDLEMEDLRAIYAQYPMWSPYNSYEAADALLKLLKT